MLKQIIALSLICAMLVPLSPAVAADETTVTPTIEEILNSYHNKAFEAQSAEENGGGYIEVLSFAPYFGATP